ncbi:MAG: hypothetical protein Q3972_06985 [Corynebacterium sp.]|nr:hypothetical protein [Corynebacterium sp.]
MKQFRNSSPISRRSFLQLAGSLGLLGLGASTLSACGAGQVHEDGKAAGVNGKAVEATAGSAISARVITNVMGDGLHLTGVALEFEQELAAQLISSTRFTIPDHTISKVYTNSSPVEASTPSNGRYIILSLDPADVDTKVIATDPTGQKFEQPISVQINDATDNSSITTTNVTYTTVEDFESFGYVDSQTGLSFDYNLYIPEAAKSTGEILPLVVFLPDSSCLGPDSRIPLLQGLGAVRFAEESEQRNRPCFVLAPHFEQVIADDSFQIFPQITALLNLIDFLGNTYSIDRDRIYGTGQAMGGMGILAMSIARPELFAATYLVSTHWDPQALIPIAKNSMWFSSSAGDEQSFLSVNAIADMVNANGGTATSSTAASQDDYSSTARDLAAAKPSMAALFYGAGTLPDLAAPGMTEHTATWVEAYTDSTIREWLFAHKKEASATTSTETSVQMSTEATQDIPTS